MSNTCIDHSRCYNFVRKYQGVEIRTRTYFVENKANCFLSLNITSYTIKKKLLERHKFFVRGKIFLNIK